ncbi:MAG: hypothetical protein R3C52_09925 [Hyphomonadaceae bacterium]
MHAPNNLRALDWMRQHLGASEEQIREWYAATVRATFDPLEQRLASISTDNVLPFGEPGMFEIMLVPQVYNARRFGIDMNAYPRLSAIDAHCRALDAFATAAPEAQPDAPAARS